LSKRLVSEFGFRGIFLDAEPVWDGDQDFLALLRAIRGSVGISVPISAAISAGLESDQCDIPSAAADSGGDGVEKRV